LEAISSIIETFGNVRETGIHNPDRVLQYDWKDGILVLKFDTPNCSVNKLNLQVMEEVKANMEEVRNREEIVGVVLMSGKPGTFIVGADIDMIELCKVAKDATDIAREGQQLLNMIEDFPKPVVVAINGICLGGGLEISLSCHYRIAVGNKNTFFSLPEVMLGILPGLGGTQRLPRLLMLYDALDFILTGRKVRAEKAKELGLVDQIFQPLGTEEETTEQLEKEAIKMAKDLAEGKLIINRTRTLMQRIIDALLQFQFIRNIVFEKAKNKVMTMSYGLYPAPLKIIDVVQKGLNHGREIGYEEECKAFGELLMTKESQALFTLYHGQVTCKKNRLGIQGGEVKNLAVLGNGLMGTGIAQISLQNGFGVKLKGRSTARLESAEKKILEGFNSAISRMKINEAERDSYMARLEKCTTYDSFENADIVIEAVSENLELKQEVLRECERVTPERCIFATNTSSISVSKIAEASTRPDKVVGMHYFYPADKMLLLEVVMTDKTSMETAATAVNLGLKQGKFVIVVKDGPGFYTFRIMSALMSESIRILRECQDIVKVNNLTKQLGFPVGIKTAVDEIGVDVCVRISEYVRSEMGERFIGEEDSMDMMKEILDFGYLGRKSGMGFFMYNSPEVNIERDVNPEIGPILEKYALKAKGGTSDEDLKYRMLMRTVNEAVLCLQEGILSCALDGDVGAVFGLGFPPYLGGPFRYVDSFGADKIVAKMREFETHYGTSFTPCQLLLDHASDPDRKFYNK